MRTSVIEEKKGFTLIEVLIVVAIMAIIASLAYAAIGESRKKANDTQRKSDIGQLQLALRLYKDSDGSYPTGHNSGTVIGEGGSLDATLRGYLTAMVSDPRGSASNATYEYVYDTSLSCSGTNRIVLYAKSMERASESNWATVCGGTLPGTNTFGVIIQ